MISFGVVTPKGELLVVASCEASALARQVIAATTCLASKQATNSKRRTSIFNNEVISLPPLYGVFYCFLGRPLA